MKKLIYFLFTAFNCLFINLAPAQQWFNYAPALGYDINAVDILKPGYIVTGGGSNGVTPIQIMFSSPDYGVTWHENMLDTVAIWNKSVAFADTIHGFGVGSQGLLPFNLCQHVITVPLFCFLCCRFWIL